MKILGVSAHYHDSAAALVVDGVPLCAVQEERLSRKKNDASFPLRAIEWCLEQGKLEPEQLDAIVFYEKPMLKFERILTTALRAFPKSWKSFPQAIPDRTRLLQPFERARRTDPHKVEPARSALLLCNRIDPGVNARGDHMHAIDLGASAQRTIGQKIVTRNDRVDRADGPRKPLGSPATFETATIVRIPQEHGIIEVVHEMPRIFAQRAQMPSREQFALQDHRIELCRATKLKRPKK